MNNCVKGCLNQIGFTTSCRRMYLLGSCILIGLQSPLQLVQKLCGFGTRPSANTRRSGYAQLTSTCVCGVPTGAQVAITWRPPPHPVYGSKTVHLPPWILYTAIGSADLISSCLFFLGMHNNRAARAHTHTTHTHTHTHTCSEALLYIHTQTTKHNHIPTSAN